MHESVGGSEKVVVDRRVWRQAALWAIQIVVIVAICWAVFRNTDVTRIDDAFHAARFDLLALAVPVLILERIVRPWRLHVLFGSASLRDVIAAQNVALLVNLILPMRSGEMFLVVALRSLGATSGAYALSIVMVDRLMDVACVLLVFAFSIVIVLDLPDYVGHAALGLTAVCVALFGLMLGLAFGRYRAMSAAARALDRFAGRIRVDFWLARLSNMIDGFSVLLRGRTLVLGLLATTVTWTCAIGAAWFVLSAVWPEASLSAAALSISLGVIGVTLVSVPAGLGILHAAFALGALTAGASQEVAVSFALLQHFIPTAVTIVMGLLGMPTARRAGLSIFQSRRSGAAVLPTERHSHRAD